MFVELQQFQYFFYPHICGEVGTGGAAEQQQWKMCDLKFTNVLLILIQRSDFTPKRRAVVGGEMRMNADEQSWIACIWLGMSLESLPYICYLFLVKIKN